MTEIQIKKIKNNNKELKEKNISLTSKIKTLEKITTGYEEKIEDLEKEKIQFFEVNGTESLKQEIEDLKDEIENLKDNRKKDRAELEDEIQELNNDNVSLLSDNKQLKAETLKTYEIIDKLKNKLDEKLIKANPENGNNETNKYIMELEFKNERLSDKLKYIKCICYDLILDEGE